jgi:hypothetical protein
MTVLSVLDAAGRRRSPATLPGYHTRRPPRNKGMRYPADPPTVDEIVAVMRHGGSVPAVPLRPDEPGACAGPFEARAGRPDRASGGR